jgi:hypothetical protein
VGESPHTVDLHHGKTLAIRGLECLVAVDVHDSELEAQLQLRFAHDLERALAQTAAGCAVDSDYCYGYRPLVVVASATRCTASPYAAMRRLVSFRSLVCQVSSNARTEMSCSFALTSSSRQKYS